jgi:DNA helicase-2/ATP-dependent DNA helicase PcrA
MNITIIELSEKQQKAVFAENIPVYVRASAGSGKTRVLTERVRFLLKKTNKKILALTFTNKAGEEIKERLNDIPEIEKRVFLGTFHAFCQSILENHGSLIGFSGMPHIFEDESDRMELIEQAIMQIPHYAAGYKKLSEKERKNYRTRAIDFISAAKRKLLTEEQLKHSEDENLVLLYGNYQDILRSQNAIDFDDLLFFAYHLFMVQPKISALYRRSFSGICIDEAQDLNNAQYQFLRALTNGEFNNIMMVGDPNQSIFHFNGSSPEYMDKNFVNDFKPLIIELNENYRSSKSVLMAAKRLIPETEDITGIVKEGIFEIYKAEDESAEALWIVEKIQNLINMKRHNDIEGEICAEKIAVLARNKYVFRQLEEQLQNYKLSFYYKISPGPIRFESELMKIFDLCFRVKLNSQDILHKKRLFEKLKIAPVPGDGEGLEDIFDQVESPEKEIVSLVLNLTEDGSNIKYLLENFRNKLNIDENEKNMVFNDIEELLKHWHNYARKTDNKSLQQFRSAMALGKTHPLTQHRGITLSTIHTMKGQEFDIVFVMGMDDETFPDYRAIRNGGIEMTQEKNNLYVAFTRAKRFLYLTWPQKRTMLWGACKSRVIFRFLKPF